MHPRVKDRFDLTLECVRRHYIGDPSPLSATLDRHADFFALFGTFDGYVEFFLLQDLVSHDGNVSFFRPFDDLKAEPVPTDVESYLAYLKRSNGFIDARNQRIQAYDLSR